MLLDQQQPAGADLLLATVAAVTADGLSLIPDGETEATQKKYKYMTSAYAAPAVGDRVVVMRLSGTYVVLGKIGSSTPDSEKYVRRSGDTMTGLLNINRSSPGVIGKNTIRDSSETVAENTNSYGFQINDKNGNAVALYTDRYETTGENGAFMGGYRMVNGTNTGNNLRLLVDAAGNKHVYVTSPAAWRSALNALNKAGDTMSGALTMNGADINLQSTTNTIGTVPASSVSDKRVFFRDKLSTIFGKLQSIFMNDGRIGMQLGAQRAVNGSTVENNLNLYIDASGNRTVTVTSPQAWRSALLLGTSGAFPLTVAQGGTGATSAAGHAVFAGPNGSTAGAPSFRALSAADITAGTLPIARGGTGQTGISISTTVSDIFSSIASGITVSSASYVQFGKVAMFTAIFTSASAGTTTNWTTWATLKEGKRPVSIIAAHCQATTYCLVGVDGGIQFSLKQSANFGYRVSATYLIP